MSLGLLATPTVIICKVAKMVFNVAPGNFYLSQYLEYQAENGTSATVEAMTGLAGGTDAAFITTVLTNLGLADDAGAQAFLESSIAASGRGAALEAAITALNNVSATDATYGAAKTTFDTAIVTSVSYSTNKANNSTDTTVLAAAVDEAAVAAAALPDSLNLTFTTSVDTLNGAAGNDTFTGDNTGTSNTMTSADTIAGKDGTDSLNVFSDGDGDPLPLMTGVEIINIYDNDDTFDVTAVSDVTTVNAIRGDGTAIIKVDNGETVNLQETTLSSTNSAADITVNYGATATEVTLGVNDIKAGATPADDDVTLVGAKIETVNINATGTKSVIQTIDAVQATAINIDAAVDLTLADTTSGIATSGTNATITITGAGKVTLTELDAGVDTIDASGNTGGVVVTLDNEADTKFTGGSGADKVTTGGASLVASSTAAIDAGDGEDTLVVANAADLNTTAEGGKYTNFEVLEVAADQNTQLVSGITKVTVAAATSATVSRISADVADQITVTGDQATDLTLVLDNATGTTDSVSLSLASATSTSNVDIAGLSIAGVETLNIASTTGTNVATFVDTGTSDVAIGTADKLTSVVLTGAKDVSLTTGGNITKAVTIDGSALTGDFMITGDLTSGSVVTGSANADEMTLTTSNGSTYNGLAGKDTFKVAIAGLVATGVDDNIIDGGDGSDTVAVTDTGATTLTDNHFTRLSNIEKMTSATTNNLSVETGGSYNAAFGDSAEFTAASIGDQKTVSWTSGLYSGNQKITITHAGVGDATGEDIAITTGSGDDTVSFVAANWVGHATTDASIAIDTGAGDDSITLTTGTLLANGSGSDSISIDAGKGADTLTLTHSNDTAGGATGVFEIVIADGDSLVGSRDKITGYNLGTAGAQADDLQLSGTATAQGDTAGTDGTDSGTIKSHAISSGIITFDDVDTYAAALTINENNLSDVSAYLATAITTAAKTVAFAYDSDLDGANDATMVFQQGTKDTLVELVGVTGTSLTATNATTAGLIHVA